jgi:hypothetical protein
MGSQARLERLGLDKLPPDQLAKELERRAQEVLATQAARKPFVPLQPQKKG